MNKPLLTLSMIVKNEEKYLEECLDSVKNVVDEIVIVDTGSTDKTLEIAKRFNANIFHFEWIDDFSAARNFALSKSTGNWILYLDADERLNPESIKELKTNITRQGKLGVSCTVTNLDDFSGNVRKMKYVRLFSNSKDIYFEGKAHEQIQNSLIKSGYKIAQSYIEIIHHGYNLPKEKLITKAERNLKLLLSDYDNNKNSYFAYQLANTYSILDKHEQALRFYKEALKDKTLPVEYRSICFLHLADEKMRNGDIQEAHDLVKEGLALDKANTNLIMLGSQVFSMLDNYTKAIEFCKEAYRVNKSKIKNGSNAKYLDISIKPEKIVYQGLLLSLKGSDSKSFDYFLNELVKPGKARKLEKTLIINLINNTNLNDDKMLFLKKIINTDNLEFYLILFSSYNNVNIKLSLLKKINSKFGANAKYLVQVGLTYYEMNDLETAKKYFELSLEKEEKDPPAIFYLASIYLSTNNIGELMRIIEYADNTFKNNKIVQEKLQILVSKIKPLLKDV